MEPGIKTGSYVLCQTNRLKNLMINDIVVVRGPNGAPMLKRITVIDSSTYTVQGDNANDSWDSRDFGPIPKEHIIAKVIWR